MPSGNATFTYRGEEPSVKVQGQAFPQGEPTHVTDNGIIAVLREREDFAEAKPKKAAAKE